MLRISVVIPAYQAGPFIAATLDSVVAQTFAPAEVLIVDDGSVDNTCFIVEEFAERFPSLNIILIKGMHKGPGAARNIGVKRASSTWIAFLDSDDIWFPDKLEMVAAAIALNPTANFFCNNEIIASNGDARTLVDYSRLYNFHLPLPGQLFRHNLFSTSAVVCKKEDVLAVGGFDETLSSAQDYELWLRMSTSIVPVFIKKPLGLYVVREGNISTTRHFKRMLNILKVMYRHRSKAPNTFVFLLVVSKLVVVHTIAFVSKWFKK
jgi:teichuronic acid biosynthesis glycosyltransferase TuaG